MKGQIHHYGKATVESAHMIYHGGQFIISHENINYRRKKGFLFHIKESTIQYNTQHE